MTTTKLELGNVSFTTRIASFEHADDSGRIPDKLAEATLTLLRLHKANGDLTWVNDMIGEVESENVTPKASNLDSEESLTSAVLQLMNNAPNPDEGLTGLYASDVVRAVLNALDSFTDAEITATELLHHDGLRDDVVEAFTHIVKKSA